MSDCQKYINALRKCAKEHDNDITYTGHIIVSDLCRDTANLLESLEQEPILDKIRAEVEALNQDYYCEGDFDKCKDYVLDILDEYRGR